MNNSFEFLVTGQGYEHNDPYKQTILLHDTFFASDPNEAKNQFSDKFKSTHKIIKIFSSVNLDD